MTHEPAERYTGAAVLRVGGADVTVTADLRGAFQPIDGRFHWHGRVRADAWPADCSGATASLDTGHGTADGRLSDADPWGRLRITGTGRPPF